MISASQLVIFILVLTRVSAFVAFFPLFARKQLPNSVKAGLAVSLSVFWYGTVEASLGSAAAEIAIPGLVASVMLIAKELTIGLILGVTLGLFFLPAKVAGSYIGQEMGLSLASISDPGTQDSSTLLTRVFEAFSILIFFSINLHHLMLLVIHTSFEKLFGQIDVLNLPTENLVAMTNDVTEYGLMMIAPLVILFMLVTLGLSFLNKAAPTLNLFSIGLSIRIALGILCLMLFLPVIFGAMKSFMYRIQADIEQFLVAFQG